MSTRDGLRLRYLQTDFDLLHYLIALPFEIFTPSAVAVGIQTWTWLIGEKPELEFPIMTEIDAAWISTCKTHRGIFSPALK
jgi:phosphatidylinositol 4-kinase